MFVSRNSIIHSKYRISILLYFTNMLLANEVVKSETIIIDTLEDIQSSQSPIQSLCDLGYKTSADFECEGSYAIPVEDQISNEGFWSGCDMGGEVCGFTYTKQNRIPVSILIKAYFKGDTKINIETQTGVTESIKGNNEWRSKAIEVSNFESIDTITITPVYDSSDAFVIIDQFIFEFDEPTSTTTPTTTVTTTISPTTTKPTTTEITTTAPATTIVDVIGDLTSSNAWEDNCLGGYQHLETYMCDSQSVIPPENYTGNVGYWNQCPGANILVCELTYHVTENEMLKEISVEAYFTGNAGVELEIRKIGGYTTRLLQGSGWTTVDFDLSDQLDILEITISPEYHSAQQLAVVDKITIY